MDFLTPHQNVPVYSWRIPLTRLSGVWIDQTEGGRTMNNLRDHNDLSAQTSFHNLTILGEHRGGGDSPVKQSLTSYFCWLFFSLLLLFHFFPRKQDFPPDKNSALDKNVSENNNYSSLSVQFKLNKIPSLLEFYCYWTSYAWFSFCLSARLGEDLHFCQQTERVLPSQDILSKVPRILFCDSAVLFRLVNKLLL